MQLELSTPPAYQKASKGTPTAILEESPIPPMETGNLDVKRTNPETREIAGVISLPPAVLKQLAVRYIDRPDTCQTLTVSGQKEPGKCRFQASVALGIAH